MIIRLKNEKNLVEAVDVKLIKTSDFQDTLAFKVPIDENITVDEKIRVKTKVFNEDYRVKEIISKVDYKDVFCEHVMLDSKNVVIPYIDEANRNGTSINDFSRYTDLRAITSHLNRIMRSKGDNEFVFSADFNKSGVVECNDTPLYDLIFGEKGILDTFKCSVVYHNHNIKFVEKAPSKNTEILFYEKKNISELQETVDFKNIITKLHITATYRQDNSEEGKAERERLKAQKRRELFEKSQQRIKDREEKQRKQREEKRKQQEAEYQANRSKPKRTQAEIHADYLKRQEENERRIQANNEARRIERERRFNEKEQQRVITSKNKEEEFTFRTVYTSPLIGEYDRPYEAAMSISSDEITDAESLKAWCVANLFTEEDTRDVPIKNFSFKPVEEDYNVDINDRAKVVFTSLGVNKIVYCCKIEYDALHDKYLNIEFGVLNTNRLKQTIGSINNRISDTKDYVNYTRDILDSNFQIYINKELEAYDEQFRIDKQEFEDNFNARIDESSIIAEQTAGQIATDIDNKIDSVRSDLIKNMDTLDAGLDEAKKDLAANRLKLDDSIRIFTTDINELKSRDFSVAELRKLAEDAKVTGENATKKVTELEGSVKTELTQVKNDTITKAEFKTGVDGLSAKISTLEEYKNNDGTRTQTLKNWVQQDTADKLARERTEVTKIIDERGFVKDTQFSSKFEENARGITRQLTELNAYKNEDGSRQETLKRVMTVETARLLQRQRDSIEQYINNKGYATVEYANNKVQETANSFSREISNVRSQIPTELGSRNYLANTRTPHTSTLVNDNFAVDTTVYNFVNKKSLRELGFKVGDKITFVCDYEVIDNKKIKSLNYEYYGDSGYKQPTHTENKTKGTFVDTKVVNDALLDSKRIALRADNVNAKIITSNARLIKGTIATDWTPAPEDATTEINQLNTWKQTASETLNRVSSELNGAVKYSQLKITDSGINFGSGYNFDGKKLASMINVSPDAVNVITNKMVIANINNLVRTEYKGLEVKQSTRDLWISGRLPANLLNYGDEYILKVDQVYWERELPWNLNLELHIRYKNKVDRYYGSSIAKKGDYWDHLTVYTASVKVPPLEGEVDFFEFKIAQNSPVPVQPSYTFVNITYKGLQLYKKTDAELIVDGSIEGRHIKAGSMETGHFKAGSVTADIINTNAVRAKHMLIDEAMINKFATNKAFITRLWAEQAFINELKAVSINASQITGGLIKGELLKGVNIEGAVLKGDTTIKIGEYGFMQPIDFGLQINAPEALNSKKGVGVQIHGYKKDKGNGRYIPKGMYIYHDDDFYNSNTPEVKNETLLTVSGMIMCRSMRDGNGVYKTGYAIPTIMEFNEDGKGLYPIFNMYHQDKNGTYLLFTVPGKNFSVETKENSDIRLKKNIKDTKENALMKINRLNFKEFDWRGDGKHVKLGLIAQEVEKVEKDFIDIIHYEDGQEVYTLNTKRLNVYTLKATQELYHNQLSQDEKILQLETKIKQLEAIING